ncbi:hypothetical protein IWQ61_000568 [Dispira simplex]|nr:hypothetical protein IWQ61_000568 [Dispira simplex]
MKFSCMILGMVIITIAAPSLASQVYQDDDGLKEACANVKAKYVEKWDQMDRENASKFSTFIVRMLDRYKPAKPNRYLREYLRKSTQGQPENVLTCLTWFHSEKQARTLANRYNSKTWWSKLKSNAKGLALSPLSSRYDQYNRSVRKANETKSTFPWDKRQGYEYRSPDKQPIYLPQL